MKFTWLAMGWISGFIALPGMAALWGNAIVDGFTLPLWLGALLVAPSLAFGLISIFAPQWLN